MSVSGMDTCTIELLAASDLVAMAQCMTIDADAFPYASAGFGVRAASERTWVARRERRVDGFLAARVTRGTLYVHGLAVAQDARGRGLGRALVRNALARSVDEGLGSVRLHVWVGNSTAIALYRSEDFALVRRMRGFYRADAFEGAPDAYEMVRALGR
jgi:ribosomal protein S18 acetylase RimI-like enzyme